jgi:hypothetical protein
VCSASATADAFELTQKCEQPTALPAPLLACRKENKRNKLDDIGDVIEVSQQVMSFGKFYSSKTLGSHLMLTNKTTHEQTVHINVD